MDRWEYVTVKYETTGFWGGKVDTDEFTNILNNYGQDGWEAVSCFDTNYSQGTTRYVFVLLKRKR